MMYRPPRGGEDHAHKKRDKEKEEEKGTDESVPI
jgi:hypothetical protein